MVINSAVFFLERVSVKITQYVSSRILMPASSPSRPLRYYAITRKMSGNAKAKQTAI